MTTTFPLKVTFRSDWGVSTGTGLAGGVDSVVETDERGLPVVRGTVLTGVIREQSWLVAQALDGGASGPWHDFIAGLFGSAERPRLVTFSDARMSTPVDSEQGAGTPEQTIHEVVSLKIDEKTGTAQDDHLRFFERARACDLTGTAELLDFDPHGRQVTWNQTQRQAAELVLALSALLVRGIGSNRSDGDGVCEVLIGGTKKGETADNSRTWCRRQLTNWADKTPAKLDIAEPASPPEVSGSVGAQGAAFYQAPLDIALTTPVVSYEVPFSNEIRSLDFLRGTALLPLVHHRLRAAFKDDKMVRDAVVTGDLLISDALAVVGGQLGMPMPLVLSKPKMTHQETPARAAGSATTDKRESTEVVNRLLSQEPKDVHVPLRSGFVFPGLEYDDVPGTNGALGAPALVGRQSTAHDSARGTAGKGQLFLVKALPAGLSLRATITMSKRLYEHISDRLGDIFPPGEARPEYLGSRRLSGTYGRATCRVGSFHAAAPPEPTWDDDGATTLWFTSDVIVRSPRLGPGGRVEDLLGALRAAGAPVAVVDVSGCFAAGVRHRRVDSWAAADRQPRASRIAISAGSVLRVRPADGADARSVMSALAQLSLTGVGELTAQGFGRFVVGHELLERTNLTLASLHQEDFIGAEACGAAVPNDREER